MKNVYVSFSTDCYQYLGWYSYRKEFASYKDANSFRKSAVPNPWNEEEEIISACPVYSRPFHVLNYVQANIHDIPKFVSTVTR